MQEHGSYATRQLSTEVGSGIQQKGEASRICARGSHSVKAIRSAKDQSASKLALNWEWLYQVTATTRTGAYYLEDLEERPLPRL